ncbi:MAG: LysM peptidoglycan-binding domain-containing protein [Aggregatilineales bacterium]
MFKRGIAFLLVGGVIAATAMLYAPVAAQTGTDTPVPTDTPAETEAATTAQTAVPSQTPLPVTFSNGVAYYTVQPGDNLFRIGLKFGLNVQVMASANGIVNPNIIYVGQRLVVPGVSPSNPLLTPAPIPTSTGPILVNPNAPATYTVQARDNLFRIALKFGTTTYVLAQLNGLANPNLIYVGEVLKLPTSGVVVSPATPAATTESSGNTSESPTEIAPTTPTAAPASAAAGAGNVGFAVGVAVSGASDPASVAAKVTDLGATWVKQVVSWKAIEATQGSPDYSALDTAVDSYAEAHLNILLTLTNAPDWARTSTAENGPPTDFSTFATFAANTAAHYKGKVHAYEIWDEPNLRRNWNGTPLSAASYVELLRQADSAIKAADSSAMVISAGLAPTGFNDGVNAINDRVFLKQAYLAGLATYADAIGAHPNGWANPPDSSCCKASPGVSGWFNDRSFYFHDTLADYRQIMKDNNDAGKFVWVTSFGWGANDGVAPADSVNDASFGFVKFTTQAEQAQYLVRGFEIGKALAFVGPMIAYTLDGCQNAGDPSSTAFYPCYYSLLDASGNPRSVYAALKAAQSH